MGKGFNVKQKNRKNEGKNEDKQTECSRIYLKKTEAT